MSFICGLLALALCVGGFSCTIDVMEYNAKIERGGFWDMSARPGDFVVFNNPSPKIGTRYDEEFFQTRQLVLVVIDQGSGNVKHELASVKFRDGALELTVERSSPPFQTMDFVTTTLWLELDKNHLTNNVVVCYK